MKQPKLKQIFSPDIMDLYTYKPESTECFMLQIWLDIGFEDSNGSDTFYLTICSPEWLKIECKHNGPQWGRHLLIVSSFNFTEVEKKIKECLASCEGKTWDEVAIKISLFAAWEFEDYKP